MYNFYCCIKYICSSKKKWGIDFSQQFRNFQTYYKQKTSLCCVSVHWSILPWQIFLVTRLVLVGQVCPEIHWHLGHQEVLEAPVTCSKLYLSCPEFHISQKKKKMFLKTHWRSWLSFSSGNVICIRASYYISRLSLCGAIQEKIFAKRKFSRNLVMSSINQRKQSV